jgi:hypothetical protein
MPPRSLVRLTFPYGARIPVYNPGIRIARGRRWLQTTLLKSGFRYVADE